VEVSSEIPDAFDSLVSKRCALCQYKLTDLRRVGYDTINGITRDVYVHKIQVTQVDEGLCGEWRWDAVVSNVSEVTFHPGTSVGGRLCKSRCYQEALVCGIETLPVRGSWREFFQMSPAARSVMHEHCVRLISIKERTLGDELGNARQSNFLQFTEVMRRR